MAPLPWATKEQSAVLHAYIADFMRRQVEKKLHLFWPTIYGIWFSQFPEQAALSLPLPSDPEPRALTPNEKQKLGNAIENRKNGKHRAGPLDTVLAALLDSQQPQAHKRARHAIQVFQTRNREAIRAALTREGYDQLPEHDD
ncbi:hypothetical protein B0H14DRAFT_3444536 [Mycena olivaceomarginata]|nr:hypothetical protein B0H14DRAFT_3444536 [Mycena olivaceomarginata]